MSLNNHVHTFSGNVIVCLAYCRVWSSISPCLCPCPCSSAPLASHTALASLQASGVLQWGKIVGKTLTLPPQNQHIELEAALEGEEEAAPAAAEGGGGGGGGGAGPANAADTGAGARWDSEQAEKRHQEQAEKAAAEDVEVEVSCWGGPPAPKKDKKDGDGSSKDRALELIDSQEYI